MTQEQFEKQNPIICSTYGIMGYNSHEALLIQGEFFATRTFIFDTLDTIEADVLRLRYGVDNQDPMQIQVIADKLGIALKDVKETELRAVRKLRHPSRIKLLKQYTDETIDRSLLERFNNSKAL